MQIKLFNFLTRKKEVFKPIKKRGVGLYTCGPTVYNYAHIGNLRTYVFEDVLHRTLESAGYKVKHIMNITDIDDKIIKNANAENLPIQEFVRPYEKAFFEDLAKLNIEPAWKYPEATADIEAMARLIKKLLSKKLAYKTDDGIYFDISKFKNYGKLSRLRKSDFLGKSDFHRTNSDEYEKGSAEDFVLWKAAKPREPSWPASFGEGRPGWHIECSAMSMKYLGTSFDIHAGGVDLLFPHHENEIAQSEGATGKRFVKYFMEGEHLLVDGQKMSKSLGNIFTLQDLEKKNINPLAFRYLVLGAHYRSKLNFTWESLAGAEKSLERLREFVLLLKRKSAKPKAQVLQDLAQRGGVSRAIPQQRDMRVLAKLGAEAEAFQKAGFDDLNTPKALAVLWKLVNEYNKSAGRLTDYDAKYVLEEFFKFDKVLGLGLKDLKPGEETPGEVLKLAMERETARKAKNFVLADEIRRKIQELGWRVNDTANGSQVFHL